MSYKHPYLNEKCGSCYNFHRITDGIGYCSYTYDIQFFMTNHRLKSMCTANMLNESVACDQWEEAGTDLFSANTDPYDIAS